MNNDVYQRSLTRNFISQCLEDAVYLLQMPECAGIGDAPGSVIQVAGMLLELRMLYATESSGRLSNMYNDFKPDIPQEFRPDKPHETNK